MDPDVFSIVTPSDEPPEDFIDWGAPTPLKNPTVLEGAGLICETACFDSFYNASGDRLVLPAGQKYKDTQDRGFKSALSITTHWNRDHDLSHTVLDIRSPHMKAALKATVPEYSSFNIATKHISISGDPWCLYHYRQELREYGEELQTERDHEAATHVHHLLAYMWERFDMEIITFTVWAENPEDAPSLDHKSLWMVYREGDIVFVREKRLAFVFKKMTRNGRDWMLTGHHIDFDGSDYGSRSIRVSIEPYDGFKLLRDLTATPFDRLPESEQETLRKELVARGRKFISLQGNKYRWYDGKCKLWPGASRTMVGCFSASA